MANVSNFVMMPQTQTQWCWAAVSVSVFHFFNDLRWPDQCKLVNDVFRGILEGEDCCQNGDSNACNIGWDIAPVLRSRGHLAERIDNPVTFDVLSRELDVNEAPVVIRVEFDDGLSDHFMAIVGCLVDASGARIVHVADPGRAIGNYSIHEFDTFPSNYRPGMVWRNTYCTKASQ